ncbi:MFS transporter [Pseudomonas sp. efr-133-TYG-5]|jgi:PPP family 3-phenylpropionic acid transporter|uniref:MFS transporter n=1 Tax=Pseudomonas sp. efr-133-TYG-5 TaxID=3040310 RepID=UPI0025529037|nr:MFS transporter [Pseudomonas sp. efr-133-TYG-5]
MYLIFFGFFAAEGIIYPFWPTWLDSLGFSASQIGLLIAAAYWPQVFSGVLITYVADWRVDQLRLAAALGFSAALCTLLFCFIPTHLWLFVGLSVLFGGLWMVVLPLSEAYLLKRDKQALQNYGWVRAVGSSAFILTSTLGGLLFARYGQSWVPLVIAASMLLTGVACLRLKRQVSRAQLQPRGRTGKRPDGKALFAHKSLLLAIAAASCIQLSHTLYFSTASIGWGVKGYSASAIGMFWAVAVLAEITWFALSNKVLAYAAPLSIVMFSSVCAAVRWALFSNSDALTLILLGQCLHALSFAAYHAAIMRFIRDHAPQDIQVFTQGVYYSLAVALPMGLATPFAGYLYETQPQWSYYVMALFALSGTGLAFLAHQKMRSSTHGTKNVYSRLL